MDYQQFLQTVIGGMSERLYVTFDKDRQIQSINDLGESMYKDSVNDSYGNVCLSPLNMSMVLAMLYTGAGSGTRHLISNMLDARMDDETEVHLHSMFTDLQTKMKKNSKSFCFVNKILMLEFDDVCEKYQNDLQEYYHTTVSQKTFAKTVNDAGDEICDDTLDDTENKLAVRWGFLTSAQICESVNLWTAMKTKERIKNILQEDDIDSENKSMLVISAAYLHSTWQIPFQESAIEKFSSINEEGQEESIYVEMMAVHEYFPVCYLDDAICVKLRYIDDLSLIIVMPTTSLCCLQTIAINNILDHFKTLSATEIRLKLPAFDIDCDLQAESILSSRGISEIFNKSADFTGVSSSSPCYVSSFAHRSAIRVDSGEGYIHRRKEDVCSISAGDVIVCNKPFMYIVSHDVTGTAALVGRVNRPTTCAKPGLFNRIRKCCHRRR